MSNPHSTATIAGHPLHPMIVPFPIAFFTAALACDLAAIVLPWGLVLSVIAIGLMLFTGWKGWEMVYRHRVGMPRARAKSLSSAADPDRDRDRRSRIA